eukprot:SAG31_NODE_5386_length_2572_cov_1.695916_1_plen_712_part_10
MTNDMLFMLSVAALVAAAMAVGGVHPPPIAWEVAPEVLASTAPGDPHTVVRSLRLLPHRVYLVSHPIAIRANDTVFGGLPGGHATLLASPTFGSVGSKEEGGGRGNSMKGAMLSAGPGRHTGPLRNLTIADLEIDGRRSTSGLVGAQSGLRHSDAGLSVVSVPGSAGAVSSGLRLERLHIHDHNFGCLFVEDWSAVALVNSSLAHVGNAEFRGYGGQPLSTHSLGCGGRRYAWYCSYAHTLYFTRTDELLIEGTQFDDAMWGSALTMTGCFNTLVRGCFFSNMRQSVVYHADGGYTRNGDNMSLVDNRAENCSSIGTVGSPNFAVHRFEGKGFLFGLFLHGGVRSTVSNVELSLGGATPSAADTDMGPAFLLADGGGELEATCCRLRYMQDNRNSSLLTLDGPHTGQRELATSDSGAGLSGVMIEQTEVAGRPLNDLLRYSNDSASCSFASGVILANSSLSGRPAATSSWAGAMDCTPPPIRLANVSIHKFTLVERTHSAAATSSRKRRMPEAPPPLADVKQFGWYFVNDTSELPHVSTFSTSIFVGNGGNALTASCTDAYAPCAVPLLAAADIRNLTTLAERNMTAILNGIQTIFQSDVATLLPDWRQRWATYWNLVRPHAKAILAFYPMDEPPHTWPPTGAYKNMTKLIKATAPDIPIAATLSPSIIRGLEYGAYDLPPEVDWVGFDSYNCWQWDTFLGDNASQFGCFDN